MGRASYALAEAPYQQPLPLALAGGKSELQDGKSGTQHARDGLCHRPQESRVDSAIARVENRPPA